MTNDSPVPGIAFRLPLAFAVYTATSAFVFATFYSANSPFSFLAIPLGGMLGYVAAHLRQRLTPSRYTFTTVPESKPTQVLKYLSAIAATLAIWHIANANWMGLWSVLSVGGLAILMIASDFGYFTRRIDERETGG
jgi:hypothetical protein